ncbi:P-loop containing nucleoside triphosphate hydrolase protein [Pelagophyceae sp. CCMP2097]|nr:P-loop containing nucleoside triphosphate hydrolase protein [Pelagophyceae sp. CCMP2097]
MELFSSAAPKKKAAKRAAQRGAADPAPKKAKAAETCEADEAADAGEVCQGEDQLAVRDADAAPSAAGFDDLGLLPWLCEATRAMGLKWPTPVQAACIPRILGSKSDVLALAETGSGKTAAFALPLLQQCFGDPYGVYCLILSPARELAVQIAEQFSALGARANVKVVTVIGGEDSTKQSLALRDLRPHFVVATPGRLAQLFRYSDDLRQVFRRVDTLVLDEADRLLDASMADDLAEILSVLPPPRPRTGRARRTLFFSATLSPALAACAAVREEFSTVVDRVDLSKVAAVPAGLAQEYLFMPNRVKMSYFVGLLKALGVQSSSDTTARVAKKGESKAAGAKLGRRVESCIIFVQTCKRCHELHALLVALGVKALCLHSKLGQPRRLAALGKFKSRLAQLLVCTDVAARGLDIPSVELVVNYDVPRVADDYIHRVGRTARAGKAGRAVTLVTQRDVELLHAIEARVGLKLELCADVVEKDVLPLLNPVGKAMVEAQKQYPWTHDAEEKR